MSPKQTAHRAAEKAARNSYGRLLAFLAARTRDVAGAEDALAEAFATALTSWPRDGIPANPDGWLLTVARRRQVDTARRRATRAAGEPHMRMIADELAEATADETTVPDRRLALMFACAHPAIEPGMRAPLILQTILGLTAADIAAAFLIPPATMGQRLARAKTRLKTAAVPFEIPQAEQLPDRLDAVLAAIYAAFTKGWSEGEADGPDRLVDEAIWLGRLVTALLPGEPEAKGMLALMLYSEARRPARRDIDGHYVPLDRQDITLWDTEMIVLAESFLAAANEQGATGRYQIEAAIQSAHVARRLSGADSGAAIVALYDVLMRLSPSPVVALNRAAALAETGNSTAALAALEAIADDPRMADYQPYWATRAHLLARLQRPDEAYQAFTLAMGLSDDPAIRHYLAGERAKLQQG